MEVTNNEEYDKVFFGEEEPAAEEAQEEVVAGEEQPEETQEEAEQEVQESEDQLEEEAEEQPEDTENTETEEDGKSEEDGEKEEDEHDMPPDEEMVKLKWNGKDIEVTKEEALKLAQQGYDYTFKTQSLAKYKKQFEAMEKDGITADDIQLLSKIKAGDKEALAYLSKENNIDVFDAAEIENPNVTLQKEEPEIVISSEVNNLIEQISTNEALLNKMQQAESVLPDAVIKSMAQDPELFYGVVSEVETGSFDKVMPMVQAKIASMSELDKSYIAQNPQQFAAIYVETKNGLEQPKAQTQDTKPKPKPKPNMAEVGINKSNTATRQAEVIRDAFTDDSEYQRILNRVRNQ